ncbi:hypothetical protein D0Z07_3389 [Hyphodiscus hymeniophilus]|uniref:Uncharacterized protein n=1 Tax=Hyphodiscus hymeniophilus TaxID=353542 RepID=A0A9P6VLC5_9HELO|nr:hypothetical protein D0Z07_3389 [Hyphodiscus hymeniophilus]
MRTPAPAFSPSREASLAVHISSVSGNPLPVLLRFRTFHSIREIGRKGLIELPRMAPATGTPSLEATATSVAPFAITTTWTAPSQCAQSVGGLTMLEVDQYRVWLNAILPVPGVTSTSCYPSQFISSFLLQTGGVSQPAMSPLVCPAGYTTQGPFTSNYIACCPSGWDGLALASDAPSDRPAFGGTCYSNIYNVPISVSFYDNSALKATSIFTATDSAAQAFASPYEGFALGVVVVQSTTGAGSSTPASTGSLLSSSSVTAAPNSGALRKHSSTLSSGAIAGIVIGALAGLALLALASFFILRHRRRNYHVTEMGEREFQYGGSTDDQLKVHSDAHELGTQNYVYEMGDGQTEEEMQIRDEAGWTLIERDKKLPEIPSPASPTSSTKSASSAGSASPSPISPQIYR